ncbi:MAG: hypothetical protein A2096_07655 [Spirochaetes bacterium GWF1_41_5]|nr:MAG: hypothetical protein A2096_07655 [Spirochaetes bacterium GWF1_41_5]HBE01286.1 hypothetical protein [Spirochaetia bacterium]
MRKLIIICTFVIALTIIYIYNNEKLPPRTPIKIINRICELKIPSNVNVEKYDEQWNANGDGYCLIILNPDNKEFESILSKIRNSNSYQRLPIKNLPNGFYLIGHITDYLPKNDAIGYYKLKIINQNDGSYEIVIADMKVKKIIIYFSIV